MKCDCGLVFPRTRNGLQAMREHLDGPAGLWCDGEARTALFEDIMGIAMELFSVYYGDDLPVPKRS